ncbi:polyadenylate-binding protein RBP47-like [Canna indica]|uniref:Polyadenylate-binding protein RBP47-like n=1 Tax=Canna indica TaxID=4628 RepID=A0AAQ3JWW6_9LILI|nr:polyadenylate-binding protein RBP47-like [Canna indica]
MWWHTSSASQGVRVGGGTTVLPTGELGWGQANDRELVPLPHVEGERLQMGATGGVRHQTRIWTNLVKTAALGGWGLSRAIDSDPITYLWIGRPSSNLALKPPPYLNPSPPHHEISLSSASLLCVALPSSPADLIGTTAEMQPATGIDPRRTPPPQPWATVRYPAQAVVMQHPMMAPPPPPPPYGHPFVPYHQPPTPPPPPPPSKSTRYQQGGETAAEDEKRTIWVGDLQYWMDENYLHSCFGHTGEVFSIKVIRNKQTGQSEGYGFVEFHSHATAEKVLQSFSSHIMPNTDQPFRLNWASFSTGDKHSDLASDHSIFVGDLASDVTDAILQETFSTKYTSVKGAKVVVDANTGRSKGYGFVRFGDENEKKLAITEMNGVYCSTRPMRIGLATPRKGGFGPNGASAAGSQQDVDSTNTTVFVGGLDPDVSEDDLKEAFSQYGEIASVKIPVGKQCGFVLFVYRNNAEEAMQQLNGTTIGKQTVRLSWGRNPAKKQSRAERGRRWNNVYYGAQVYDGYSLPPHYPGMYALAYGAYPFYGHQQQVN